jgi:hypothetical protein
MPTNTQPRYQPAPTVVHAPLPFNPYEITKEEKVVTMVEKRVEQPIQRPSYNAP